MPSIRVGQTEIAYEVRRTAKISERRITVTPGCVEVVALRSDDDADIDGFLRRKRQWLFDTVREMEESLANRPVVPRFMSGSKIPFRGRYTSLTVRRHDGEHIELEYKNGFIVDLPSWVTTEEADTVVAGAIKHWLKQRVRRDVPVTFLAHWAGTVK
jgi:predicted metal-dependent hydrolase